jgi:cytochrome c-type biogenesis protein CcmH
MSLMSLFRRAMVSFALALILFVGHGAVAVEPAERLSDPALEARARAIGAELRCLVCQNESIDESGAELAHDIRMLVRKRLTAGDSNEAVIQSVVDRYGSFVLLRPPVERSTWILWFGPAALVLIGVIGAALWLRRSPTHVTASPLNDEEKARLATIVQEDDR